MKWSETRERDKAKSHKLMFGKSQRTGESQNTLLAENHTGRRDTKKLQSLKNKIHFIETAATGQGSTAVWTPVQPKENNAWNAKY